MTTDPSPPVYGQDFGLVFEWSGTPESVALSIYDSTGELVYHIARQELRREDFPASLYTEHMGPGTYRVAVAVAGDTHDTVAYDAGQFTFTDSPPPERPPSIEAFKVFAVPALPAEEPWERISSRDVYSDEAIAILARADSEDANVFVEITDPQGDVVAQNYVGAYLDSRGRRRHQDRFRPSLQGEYRIAALARNSAGDSDLGVSARQRASAHRVGPNMSQDRPVSS